MRNATRTALSLMVGALVLTGTLAMAQPAKNSEKDKHEKQHHSRLAKFAFWRRHKDTDKKAKVASTHPHARAPQQQKGASPKQSAAKTDQAPKQQASKTRKAAVHNTPATNKPKAKQKPQEDSKTAALNL